MGLTGDWLGRTELTRAILRKDTARALDLLEQGANPCHADDTRCSDLYFAAIYSEPEVLRELLRRGGGPQWGTRPHDPPSGGYGFRPTLFPQGRF